MVYGTINQRPCRSLVKWGLHINESSRDCIHSERCNGQKPENGIELDHFVTSFLDHCAKAIRHGTGHSVLLNSRAQLEGDTRLMIRQWSRLVCILPSISFVQSQPNGGTS
eukprot:scaffold991_cov128-Cylindrotheca_fusiformis.AAC.11